MTRDLAVTLGWTFALLACPAGARAQLQNGGFDDNGGSLAYWTLFNNVVPNVLSAALAPRSGIGDLKLFGGYNGNPNYSGLFQGLPAAGGQTWRASGYARHNSGDSLAGTQNSVVLKIEFYSTMGGAYGTPDLLQETAVPLLDANQPMDTWLPGRLQVRAPPGTVEARVVVVFAQTNYAGGAALIDDVTFDLLPAPWTTVWQDQFSGTTVDTSKWNVVDGYNGGNNELSYYAPDDVYVENGNLVLRSQSRAYSGHSFTSGQVNTYGHYAPVYGRIEVRARLPWGKGYWPAHWMLPAAGQWPPEIDLMELIGDVPWRVTMSQHWGPLPPGTKPWDIGQTAGGTFWGPDFTQGFHTFAIEWFPGQLFWYIDDVLRASSVRPQVPSEPMYLILNTAVGGDWPGPPDGSTPFPAYHLVDYVRVSVPSDPGDALLSLVDTTSGSAAADGVIALAEYAHSVSGINHGLGDRIGANSTLYVDSGADGQLNFGFRSAAAWPSGAWGVVIYVDTVPGGFASTEELGDATDAARRLASGKGSAGQRSDLHFALGFTADYAVVLQPAHATVYQLGKAQHVVVNGADLESATDMFGGQDVRYRIDDGSAGSTVRELQTQLWHFGLTQGSSFRFIVTMLNGDTAFRTNEFIGVAPGNAWDGAFNPGQTPVVLKPGDFIAFRTSPRRGDSDADGDVDFGDFVAFAACLAGPGLPAQGCANAFDFNTDGAVDLADYAALQVAGGTAAGLT